MNDDPQPASQSDRRSPMRVLAAFVAAAAVVAAAFIVFAMVRSGPETIAITVPAGTQDRIDAGEPVELIPAVLEVNLGDRIVITNNDRATHVVGPYIVGPLQTIEQQFTYTGRIEGICTLHPSGEVAIVVR